MLRTIEAPGIEIREVDKSTYARSLTGTNVLVAGFANKGKDYIPMVMTSKNAWLNYYGQPTNEAERYFYRASMEVINQGGKLYASKLPYANDAKDIYIRKKYTVGNPQNVKGSNYKALLLADATIDKYSAISSTSDVTSVELSVIEEYETGEDSPDPGEIIIIDALRSKYDAASFKDLSSNAKEYLGIVPVITTAANAMFYQSLLDLSGDLSSTTSAYYTLSSIESLSANNHTLFSMLNDEVAIPFYSSDRYTETISNKVNRLFPAVQYVSSDKIDRDNLLKIGLVVLKAYVDPSAGNKINFDVLESYVGELDRNAKDPSTGATTFIQEIINSQSQYIEIFIGDMTSQLSAADILTIKEQKAGSLGFYSDMVKKEISYTDSISEGLLRVYEKNSDINEKDIDLVVDAGVSNIAQYICSMYESDKKGIYAPEYSKSVNQSGAATSIKWTLSKDNSNTWRDIITSRYNEFCKNTRRDCMFIADGLRPFCIEGSKKIVRPSKPSVTIESAIIPKLKYMSGINTSYGAGYCDWFEVMDEFSGKLFWCPPSIQACGVYINTDLNANYWDAPAGLNRGMITALDTAFSPTIKQAGEIYQKCWNYAINYPDAGITLEGQKTFQVKPSAFDRVNVRRMFLRLERYVYKIARYYVYEGNTAYNRQRFVDQIVPYFETVKRSGGMYDYKIICDESINTQDVIDNNELRIKIGIKPTKTIEFILLQFVCLRTGGSFEEM